MKHGYKLFTETPTCPVLLEPLLAGSLDRSQPKTAIYFLWHKIYIVDVGFYGSVDVIPTMHIHADYSKFGVQTKKLGFCRHA